MQVEEVNAEPIRHVIIVVPLERVGEVFREPAVDEGFHLFLLQPLATPEGPVRHAVRRVVGEHVGLHDDGLAGVVQDRVEDDLLPALEVHIQVIHVEMFALFQGLGATIVVQEQRLWVAK